MGSLEGISMGSRPSLSPSPHLGGTSRPAHGGTRAHLKGEARGASGGERGKAPLSFEDTVERRGEKKGRTPHHTPEKVAHPWTDAILIAAEGNEKKTTTFLNVPPNGLEHRGDTNVRANERERTPTPPPLLDLRPWSCLLHTLTLGDDDFVGERALHPLSRGLLLSLLPCVEGASAGVVLHRAGSPLRWDPVLDNDRCQA
eukprot:scaffold1598_cov405-Pavlova_lutheri.AAC.1